jgi:hypothetical protein
MDNLLTYYASDEIPWFSDLIDPAHPYAEGF